MQLLLEGLLFLLSIAKVIHVHVFDFGRSLPSVLYSSHLLFQCIPPLFYLDLQPNMSSSVRLLSNTASWLPTLCCHNTKMPAPHLGPATEGYANCLPLNPFETNFQLGTSGSSSSSACQAEFIKKTLLELVKLRIQRIYTAWQLPSPSAASLSPFVDPGCQPAAAVLWWSHQ